MYAALTPLLLAVWAIASQAGAASLPPAGVEHTFEANINLSTYAESPGVPNVTSLAKYGMKCRQTAPATFLCNLKQLSREISGHVPTVPDQVDEQIVPFEVSYVDGVVPSIKVQRDITCKQLNAVRKIVALVNPGVKKPEGRTPPYSFVAKEQSVMGDCYTSFSVTVGEKQNVDATPGFGLDPNAEATAVEAVRDVGVCTHTRQYFSSIQHIYAGATIKSSKVNFLFDGNQPVKSSSNTVGRVLLFGGLVPVTVVEDNGLVLQSIYQVTNEATQVTNPQNVEPYFDGKVLECRK